MSRAYQVKLSPDGEWHRRRAGNGDDYTACGLRIAGAYASREWVLDDRLCSRCFTAHERDTGEMKKIEQRALEFAEADAFGDDDHNQKTPVEPIFNDRTPPDPVDPDKER